MPEAVLAGTKAFWREEGQGGRPTLLLHCTMAHSGAWKGVMAALSDCCRMVAMDLPEHGRSGPRDPSVTWQTQSLQMALALLDQGEKPADLIGHSFGATVALRLAYEHPERVRSLTLIEPVFLSAAKDAKRPEYDAHMVLHHGFYELLEKGDFEGAARAFSGIWGDERDWDLLPQAQREYQSDRIMMIRAGGESILGDGPDHIPLDRLSGLTMPVLLIEGSETDPVIPAVNQSLAGILRDCRQTVIEGAGHMAPITHPAETATVIRSFLKC